jgi:prepilin peptidase CpaA
MGGFKLERFGREFDRDPSDRYGQSSHRTIDFSGSVIAMHDDLLIFSLKSSMVLAITTLIAWGDLLHYRISNRAVLLTLMMGLAWSATNTLWIGAAMGLLGVLVGFVLLVPFYAIGGVTAGDVKWLAALGAWYGPRGIVGVFLVSSILLGVFCLASIAFRYIGFARQTQRAGLAMENRGIRKLGSSAICNKARIDEIYCSADRRSVLIPYAVPVAIGVLLIESYRAMGA